jgi:hypothetical protein
MFELDPGLLGLDLQMFDLDPGLPGLDPQMFDLDPEMLITIQKMLLTIFWWCHRQLDSNP